MFRSLLILSLVVLAACSAAPPTVDPPSTLLLPTDPDPAPAATATAIFIEDLEGIAINLGNTWSAQVAVTVFDDTGAPAVGVLISGEWSEGETGAASCTTDAAGTCDVESDPVRKRVAGITFEVTGVEHDTLPYRAELDNVADPDDLPRVVTVPKS